MSTIEEQGYSSLSNSDNWRILPWFIWILASLFYAYEFFLQVSPSVMVPDLMANFNINAAAVGNLAAIYFYAYASMQIPAGFFLDILGPRKLLTIASATCLVGAIIFGSAHFLWQAQIGRLLIGLGSAFAAIGTFKLATQWFPLNRFALITGLTLMVGMSGAVIGGAPLALLVNHTSWRESMWLLGAIGIVICLLIWFFIQDKPKQALNHFDSPTSSHQDNLWHSLLYIFKQKQSWLISIYGGLMFAPTSAFAALWGVSFLSQFYNFSRPIAASAISMIFIGWIFGSPFFGWLADYILKRKPGMYIGSIFAFLSMTLILYVKLPIFLLYSFLFGFGFFSAGFLPAFSVMREINPPRTSATALGFMNMLNMVGGAILQPLIGIVLDQYWQGKMFNHARVFPLQAYHISLLILPIILILALIILPFVKETHCRQFLPEK